MHKLNRMIWTLAAVVVFAGIAGARESKATSPSAAQGDHASAVADPDRDLVAAAASEDPEPQADDREQQERDREQGQRDREQQQRDRDQVRRGRDQQRRDLTQLYNAGTQALDQRHWERAIDRFNAVAASAAALRVPGAADSRVDGALYWKAYAENKLGRRADALTTLAALRKQYPNSGWLNDAKALELEVRASSGQKVSPDSENDEDLKLMAINSLMNSDPERALPLLQKVLEGSQPLSVKERALFVLSQNGSPAARQILAQIARGKSNPDLRRKALEDLGLFGGKESHQTLAEIYASSNDPDVKRTILHSFMSGGDRDRVLAAAKGEKDADLRRDAIHQLGLMGGQSELWELYQKDSSVDDKRAIIQGMFLGGNYEKLAELARTEKNSELRATAIRNLGLMGGRAADSLVSIYQSDRDPSDRRAVIEGLFLQNNGKALVDLARKETDPQLKRDAVEKLSLMHSKEATDYMMELLNK